MKRLLASLLSMALVLTVSLMMLPGVAVAKDKGKGACKKGGWKELVKADGTPFADQGECVGYAANGGTPRPPGTILAIAYSDLNGIDGYQAGSSDVLISKLVDTDDNGPDQGDLVVMGSALTSFAPTFVDFLVDSHTVDDIVAMQVGYLAVRNAADDRFSWSSRNGFTGQAEQYSENSADCSQSSVLAFTDLLAPGEPGRIDDRVWVDPVCPSRPDTTNVRLTQHNTADEDFIDVEVY